MSGLFLGQLVGLGQVAVWEQDSEQASQVEAAIENVYPLVRVDHANLHLVVEHSAPVACHHSN
jgi:hypothetical protein